MFPLGGETAQTCGEGRGRREPGRHGDAGDARPICASLRDPPGRRNAASADCQEQSGGVRRALSLHLHSHQAPG